MTTVVRAIDLGFGNTMMPAFGARRADASASNPPFQRRIPDAQSFRGRARREQSHLWRFSPLGGRIFPGRIVSNWLNKMHHIAPIRSNYCRHTAAVAIHQPGGVSRRARILRLL